MKKVLTIFLALSLTMTTLIGCGNTAKSKETTKESSNEVTTTKDSNDEFTLRISAGSKEKCLDIADEMFKEKYPNAKIEYIASPWEQTREKQLILMNMGDAPDILKTGGWAQEFFKDGVLEDMTDEVKTWDVYNDLTEGQKQRMLYKDKICAVNFNTNTMLLFYNKDILQKLGVEVPKTFDDLENIGKLIKENNLKTDSGSNIFATNLTTQPWELGCWIWSNGGKLMNEDYTKTLINSPETVSALKYAQDFISNGWAPMPDGTMEQMWLNGQLATYFTGEWSYPSTVDANVNVGVTTIPTGKNGSSIASTGGCDWALLANSKIKDKAYDFLKILFSEEFQLKADRGVTNLKTYENEEKRANWEKEGVLNMKLAQMEQLKTTKYNYLDGPINKDVTDIYVEALEKIFIQKTDPQTTLDEAADRINKLLED